MVIASSEMASTCHPFGAPEMLYRCYHCGLTATQSAFAFKYFDNKKEDQPRYRCHSCRKLFTLGSHGRPQGRAYSKKRNQDPAELMGLSRQCRHCGVMDNAPFKYYNNHNNSQPRFKCMSCGKQFQMRVLGTGAERRLVHTSARERPFPRHSIIRPPRPPEATTLAQMSDEDMQFSNFLEGELAEPEEENNHYTENNYNYTEADPSLSGGNCPPAPPLSDEVLQYLRFVDEADLLGCDDSMNQEALNATAAFSSSSAHVGNGTLCFTESIATDSSMGLAPVSGSDIAEVGEMYFEAPLSDQGEVVMYGTRMADSGPAAAAPASSGCCSSPSSRAVLNPVCADPFPDLPESDWILDALLEAEQDPEFQWNEDEM